MKDSENAVGDGRTKTIGLFNRKMNLSAKLPAVGFAIEFDADRTRFSRIDACDVNDLADSLPLWQRVREVVRHGPQTIATIAHELNYPNIESIDRIVRRQRTCSRRSAAGTESSAWPWSIGEPHEPGN